jgi:NitT/TauT family transport system permease protein
MKPRGLWLLHSALPPLGGLVALLVVWQGAVAVFDVKEYSLPGPRNVLEVAWEHRGDLVSAAGLTAAAAVCGLGATLLAGCALAFAFSQSALIRGVLYPYAIFLQTVPILVVAPLIIQLLGHGFWTIVAVSFIISLFPVVANGTEGLLNVNPVLLDLFGLYGASRWQVLVKLRLPNAVPYLVTGAKVASGLAVLGAVVGEAFAQYGEDKSGLGLLIMYTFRQQQTAYLYAAAFLASVLGVVFFAAVGLLDLALLRRWRGD